MTIGTANYVITIQIQNSNIPFKSQVNLPWNTLVGLPKAFQMKTNWKYWIEYIKPIWCPQQTRHKMVVITNDNTRRIFLYDANSEVGNLRNYSQFVTMTS